MITIDFESEEIIGNPIYAPPKPVGVSIKIGQAPSRYYAWGHPSENNCSFEEARTALLQALDLARSLGTGWLAHNGAFECSILRQYFGYESTDPLEIHDTMFLVYLFNPYAPTFSLKPSAERLLGIPPDEQDDLRDWVLAYVPGAKLSDWGAHISKAPGGLVGRYACGDTDRTYALYEHLMPKIIDMGMLEAYQREQRLMPILSASSRHGIRLDAVRLQADAAHYLRAKRCAEDYILSRLGPINLDSDAELAHALDRTGLVTDWVLTATGRRSTARKNLLGRVRDPLLLDYMAYRGVLTTCMGTFAGPWMNQALAEGGRLHPSWSQVRGNKGADGGFTGTRTGRVACREPNFTNVPNNFEKIVVPEDLRGLFPVGVSPLPHMRQYLLPDEGHVWLKRDFSAQEMRIMAHYAEGVLYEAFRKDPNTDPHQWVSDALRDTLGINLDRKAVKIIGFSILYGSGIPKLAGGLGVDELTGRSFKNSYYALMPEIKALEADIKSRGRSGGFIRTWGGRVYYREPNTERDLSYKLLNYLMQGSAACQTKQTIIDWEAARSPTDTFMATVYDEINISAPKEDAPGAMRRLRESMDADRFDVPFMSEGFTGPNWADIEEFEDAH